MKKGKKGHILVANLSIRLLIRVFPKIEIPENGRFTVGNPVKMDDLGVPLFLEIPIYL